MYPQLVQTDLAADEDGYASPNLSHIAEYPVALEISLPLGI